MAEREIDFNQPILDINDLPVTLPEEDENESVLTVGDACVKALLATLRDDKADGTQKLKRFNLARKIQGRVADDLWAVVTLNSKETTMVLDMAEKVWPTLTYARIYEILEGSTKEDEG